MRRVALFTFLALIFAISPPSKVKAQTANPSGARQAQNSEKVPVMDGGAGPCALDLAITGIDGKPVYAATVRVHITYGFAGIRRLDLEAGTNTDGRVRFTGLPARVHRPPLEFVASKDNLSGTATYDPAAECQAKHDIALQKSAPPQKQ